MRETGFANFPELVPQLIYDAHRDRRVDSPRRELERDIGEQHRVAVMVGAFGDDVPDIAVPSKVVPPKTRLMASVTFLAGTVALACIDGSLDAR